LEPVAFLPIFGEKGSVPVKLTGVRVEQNSMTLTVVPMTQDERAAFLLSARSSQP
jgi:hypothetical protein